MPIGLFVNIGIILVVLAILFFWAISVYNGLVTHRNRYKNGELMPNYYYTDANGQKQGPIGDGQLRALATLGKIIPTTPLETEDGHKGLAGQIPGLRFNTAKNKTHPQQNADSITSWLLDFAFRDLRLPVINLWACRIVYFICCVAAGLGAIVGTFAALFALGPHPGFLIVVPLQWLGAAAFVFLARLICEWDIIVLDWIVETTKAARIYSENNKK